MKTSENKNNETCLELIENIDESKITAEILTMYCAGNMRDMYCDWLSQCEFEWFMTFTFRYQDIHEKKALEMLRMLIHRAERKIYGKHKAGRTVNQKISMVAFKEKNSSDGFHYHCLVQTPMDLGKLQTAADLPHVMYEIWKRINGGFQFDVEHIASQEDIVRLVKYSTKEFSINRYNTGSDDGVNITWFKNRTG